MSLPPTLNLEAVFDVIEFGSVSARKHVGEAGGTVQWYGLDEPLVQWQKEMGGGNTESFEFWMAACSFITVNKDVKFIPVTIIV